MTTPLPVPSGEPATRTNVIQITLVTSDGCHLCHDAEDLLMGLGRRFSLQLERIDLTHPAGADLARRLRVPFPPVLLIDGEYFGHGRISGRKLTRALETLTEVDR